MKLSHLLLLLCAPVLFLAGVLVLTLGGARPAPTGADAATPGAAPGAAGSDPRVTALLQRVAQLERELDDVRAEQALAGHGSQRAPVEVPRPLAAGGAEDEGKDPRWYLAQYVASFQGGGGGIEYYRLVVEAHVDELVDDILPLVAAQGGLPLLRTRLAELLGDPRLTGHARVLTVLLMAGAAADESVSLAGAASAARIATPKDGPQLERRWHHVHVDQGRELLLDRIFAFVGDAVNPTVERLLAGAPSAHSQRTLVPRITTVDLPGALAPFTLASHLAAREPRLDAAHRVHEFRSDAFRGFVQAWIAREPDEEVRAALGAAAEALDTVPNHHPEQICGPPNVPNPPEDNPHAWAAATANAGREWLRLVFTPAMRAHAVRIHETCGAGAVVEVSLFDEGGVRHRVWSGDDPTEEAGVFQVDFDPTSYRVAEVEVVLDTSKVSGWNEVDAVELLGPDGRRWAKGATGSSYYGGGNGGFQLNRFGKGVTFGDWNVLSR
jgi:hypothetical protein